MAQPSEDEVMLRGAWRLLRDALEHLAWPAADQIAWRGSVMHPDELALDFDHAYGVSWMSRESGWISDDLSRHLDGIDRLTGELTDEGPGRFMERRGVAEASHMAALESAGLSRFGTHADGPMGDD
ncbi:hypothetical protein [Nonomuraea basaltis]|uniref:hypothetical protein n=1 Tax=Nonomuraea basaltis TaxID=2495887 RepID=UPI00110C46ED|nr:hypothetical protein [Nonomuraea basaltis]TMR98890.1 hypothetical protein EJK15_10125 [Nonomuraea basaltis]